MRGSGFRVHGAGVLSLCVLQLHWFPVSQTPVYCTQRVPRFTKARRIRVSLHQGTLNYCRRKRDDPNASQSDSQVMVQWLPFKQSGAVHTTNRVHHTCCRSVVWVPVVKGGVDNTLEPIQDLHLLEVRIRETTQSGVC